MIKNCQKLSHLVENVFGILNLKIHFTMVSFPLSHWALRNEIVSFNLLLQGILKGEVSLYH
jgi:hypothetical protein